MWDATDEITAVELAAELDHGNVPLALVDLRAPDEVARWRVEGRRVVPRVERPYWDVLGVPEAVAAELPGGASVAVICAHGNTSEIVARELRGVGVRAMNLAGGMDAWVRTHVAREVPGMPAGTFLVQLERLGKGCLSYVVGSGRDVAIVVDPDRFHDAYLAAASARGATITVVVDTHLHADHLSGATTLAERLRATYVLADDDGAAIAHRHPREGDDLLGASTLAVRAVALHVPGHTPGSIGVVVAERFLLSGDTLFVRGVGRPDLGGHTAAWARELHRTLTDRVAHLPDDVVVLPAHFQSRDEARPDGVFAATLGELRRAAEFTEGAEAFLATMLAHERPAPAEYAQIRQVNLGREALADYRLDELEVGKNQCAMSD